MVVSGKEKETFREVSNKETYRINESGAVMRYLSGSEEYGGSYEGFDPYGEVVPISDKREITNDTRRDNDLLRPNSANAEFFV
ncbi:MAG: hypothetical protein LBG52_06165 [Candidatus Peribacteria bacterium]|jgi:hypothetical protein|nr:hypothetical protein [Candidatus Peribacteria bacterium]